MCLTNCARMYYKSLQTEAFFHDWLNVGLYCIERHGSHLHMHINWPCVWFLHWHRRKWKDWHMDLKLPTSPRAQCLSNTPDQNNSRNTSVSHTHKHINKHLQLHPTPSSCYRNTNTSITSAYTAPLRHRLRRHVTSGTELTPRQMRACVRISRASVQFESNYF